MVSRKMYDRINWYKKEFIYDVYFRIVHKCRSYDSISRKKMLDSIYEYYSDYRNILGICTSREIKYLDKICSGKYTYLQLDDDKYKWERKTLSNKLLIQIDFKEIFIPDEIIDNVKLAIKNADYKYMKTVDSLVELIGGFCKVYGIVLFDFVLNIMSEITHNKQDVLKDFMFNCAAFRYYVAVDEREIDGFKKDILVLIYNDYYDYDDMLMDARSKRKVSGGIEFKPDVFKTIFYNDFDTNNLAVKKMLSEIKKLPFFWSSALNDISLFALLDRDREELFDAFRNVPSLKNSNVEDFLVILNNAMDEMPSGALNGFTPNQAKELKVKENISKLKKEYSYVKQRNACLSKKDADLYYKLYFALLEFTNKKYNVKPGLRIYKHNKLDPSILIDVIEKFWKCKDDVIVEFCLANPYKFTKEELEIINGFKKGERTLYFIVRFENEYTGFMNSKNIYMVKGINDNLDNIISYKQLPLPVITTILPFKDYLIYDSVFQEFSVNFGTSMNDVINNDYEKGEKKYKM